MSSPPNSSDVIQADHLSVSLGGSRILRELTFSIPGRSWTTVIGPNGSGKTTLLRAVGGLIPYEGMLQIHGREVRTWSTQALAQQLAFVRQNTSLAFDFTVEQLVRLGRAPHKHWLQSYSNHDYATVHNALERVDLDGFASRSALTLSGGELQRVFLAQALVQNASILLLDEPTTHLDVHYQFAFMDLVAELQAEGRTIVAVVHDLELAARYAGRLMVLDEGRLVSSGTPADVLTPRLLRQVFRMNAGIEQNNRGEIHIQYYAPQY